MDIISLSPANNGSDNQNYPMFNNPDENDYYILDGSVLIDAGNKEFDNVPEKDINYNIRINKGQIDIGAYENQTGASIDETIDNTLLIYPNPVKDILNIIGQNELTIEIYNSLGQRIYSDKCENNIVIETNAWNCGVYFVKINNKVFKIVK